MAASVRSSTAYTPSVATTSNVVTKPTGTTDGDILLFLGVFPANPGMPTITLPSGWTQLWQTAVNAAGANSLGDYTVVCAWKRAASEGASYTFTSSVSDRGAGIMLAIKNAAGVNASNNFTSTTGSTSFPTPSITPTIDDCLILALMGSFSSAGTLTWTPDASFTEFSDTENTNNHAAVEVETKTQTTAAAISATATASQTVNRSAGIVAISPMDVFPSFIAATTTVYAPSLVGGTADLAVPFIAAATTVYAPTLTVPPLFVTTITAEGSAVFVYYNTGLDETIDPEASQFTVTVNGVADTVTDVFVVGNSVVLALATAIPDGATVTVSYTPGVAQVADPDGDLAPAFTAATYTVAVLETPAGVSISFTDNILAANPPWTRLDSTANLVASFTVDRGRSFELDRTDVGRATVVINDRDGVLDPTNSHGPYFGLIEPLLPIALSIKNPVTGDWSMVYRGFIEELTYDEHPSQQINFLTITCVDAFEILTAIEMQPGVFGDPPPVASEGNVFFGDAPVNGRMLQALTNAGWDPGQETLFTGNVEMPGTVYSPGENVLQVLQDAADAEFPGLGNVYVSRTGKVTFHGRDAKFDPEGVSAGAGAAWPWNHWKAGDGVAVAASISDTAHIREISFNRGLAKLINSALATPRDIDPADIAGQLVTDDASIAKYGIRSWSADSLLVKAGTTTGNNANDETKLFATYHVLNYAEPRNRISQLGFKSMQPLDDRAPANWALICGAEISDRIDVTVTHPGGGGFHLEPFFIEGIHYDVRPATGDYADVTLTLDVSPQAYFAQNPFS